MKKSLIIALTMVLGAGTALGASLTVPFFLDQVTGENATEGSRTFIGLRNTTDTDLVLTLDYVSPAGVDATPEGNTFLLDGGFSVSFQPVQEDVDNEGALGVEVPDAEGIVAGALVISWDAAGPGALVGRAVQIAGDGSAFAIGLNTDASE